MSQDNEMEIDLFKNANIETDVLKNPNIAHLSIDHNKVLGSRLVSGLQMDIKELENGIDAKLILEEGIIVEHPIHLCFGILSQEGLQKIVLDVNIGEGSKVSILGHCVFPNAVNVKHIMDAKINIEEGAEYQYFERHIHSPTGGIIVKPNAKILLGEKSKFKTEFELITGRVGEIDIDYEVTCGTESVMEMLTRVSGFENDVIKVKETGHLMGERSKGVLKSRIAVRDFAKAEVYNKLTASAAYARGHVDCKEIIQGNGLVSTVPIVEVRHPKAHITHEAAIGSVDSKQLQTLMAHGLSEDEAVELIIEGLLS